MTTKEWLTRYLAANRQIDGLVSARDAIFAQCTSTTANINPVCVSSTKDPHKFDGLIECDEKINQQIDRLCEIKSEIIEAINKVDDKLLRSLLLNRYIAGLNWEQVANKIGRPASATRIKLHARALKAVEENINHNI